MKFNYDLLPDQIADIAGRKIYVFDISIWNALADQKTTESKDVGNLLIERKNSGEIFCPITGPTIWELRKQQGKSFLRTAKLMEELSLNIVFREIDQIFDNEVNGFLRYLLTGTYHPLKNNQLFGPILSYLSPSYHLNFEDENISEQQKHMYHEINREIQGLTVTRLMKMIGGDSSPAIKRKLGFQERNIEKRKYTNGNIRKMKRIQIEEVGRSIVIPKIMKNKSKLTLADQLYIYEKIEELPKSKKYGSAIEHMLSFMPMVSSYINVHTISSYDANRKDSDNDYFDREIMAYGLAYSSVFSAADRWIKSLMKIAQNEGDIGALCYASGLSELKKKIHE